MQDFQIEGYKRLYCMAQSRDRQTFQYVALPRAAEEEH